MAWNCYDYIDDVLAPDSGLSSPQRLVACAMARRGEVYWESYATLASRTGFSRRTVFTAVQALVRDGWAIRRGTGKRQTVEWRLTTPVQELHSATDAPVQDVHRGSATDASSSATDALLPVQELHTKENGKSEERLMKEKGGRAREKKAKPDWPPPAFFLPLMGLEGYRQGNHAAAAAAIEQDCDREGVSTSAVVEMFAQYWPRGRLAHGWTDPVKALVRTLDVQISKVKKGNGHRPVNDPVVEAKKDPFWADYFAEQEARFQQEQQP